MTNVARRMFLRIIAETTGAEIAEAAAVLPLMFLILLGIFWFGQAFSIYGAINRAAHEGACRRRPEPGPWAAPRAQGVQPKGLGGWR